MLIDVGEGDQPMEYFQSIPRHKLSRLLVRKRPSEDVLTTRFQSAWTWEWPTIQLLLENYLSLNWRNFTFSFWLMKTEKDFMNSFLQKGEQTEGRLGTGNHSQQFEIIFKTHWVSDCWSWLHVMIMLSNKNKDVYISNLSVFRSNKKIKLSKRSLYFKVSKPSLCFIVSKQHPNIKLSKQSVSLRWTPFYFARGSPCAQPDFTCKKSKYLARLPNCLALHIPAIIPQVQHLCCCQVQHRRYASQPSAHHQLAQRPL